MMLGVERNGARECAIVVTTTLHAHVFSHSDAYVGNEQESGAQFAKVMNEAQSCLKHCMVIIHP
jgi:hypothetical protein